MASTAITIIEQAHSEQTSLRNAVQSLVLDGLSSPHTRRAYEQALEEFLIWLCADKARPFTKAAVQRYRTELQAKGLASASINVRISAVRRLALEAGDNGLLAPEIAAGIGRTEFSKMNGPRPTNAARCSPNQPEIAPRGDTLAPTGAGGTTMPPLGKWPPSRPGAPVPQNPRTTTEPLQYCR